MTGRRLGAATVFQEPRICICRDASYLPPPGVRPLVKNTIADICSPRLELSFSYRLVFGVREVGYYDYSNIVIKAKGC